MRRARVSSSSSSEARPGGDEARALAERLLAPVVAAGVDSLLLGCTHYPYLARTIGEVMGPQVVLVSSAEETAFEVRGILSETGLGRRPSVPSGCARTVAQMGRSTGSHRWISSGEAGDFVRVGQHLFGPELDEADHWEPPCRCRSPGPCARSGPNEAPKAAPRYRPEEMLKPMTSQDLSLTVLGTDGSYPGPGGCCSGYLLQAGDFATWMDTGPGTMANLQLHIPLSRLDAVVVSHAHPDHWSDLEGLYVAMRYFLGRKGLPIYAPEGLRDLMVGENPDGTFDWRVIGDGETAQVGPRAGPGHGRTTRSRPLPPGSRWGAGRSPTPPTPGPAWALSSLGEGIQLALVEATLSLQEEGTFQHLSARQAGWTAASAGRSGCVITHLRPSIDREVALAEATAAFGSPVEVAEVGKTWTV